jgi:hypothetical protein
VKTCHWRAWPGSCRGPVRRSSQDQIWMHLERSDESGKCSLVAKGGLDRSSPQLRHSGCPRKDANVSHPTLPGPAVGGELGPRWVPPALGCALPAFFTGSGGGGAAGRGRGGLGPRTLSPPTARTSPAGAALPPQPHFPAQSEPARPARGPGPPSFSPPAASPGGRGPRWQRLSGAELVASRSPRTPEPQPWRSSTIC